MGHRILHNAKSAALPRHAGQLGRPRGTKLGAVVANDELNPEHATITERFENLAPLDLRHAPCDATSDDLSFAINADIDRRKYGAEPNATVNAHLLVPSIKDKLRDLRDGTAPPDGEVLVRLDSCSADLRRSDFDATELVDDCGDLPVLPPWTYISAMAIVTARSLRTPVRAPGGGRDDPGHQGSHESGGSAISPRRRGS